MLLRRQHDTFGPPRIRHLTTKQMLLKYLLLEERVVYGGKKNDWFWVLANATRLGVLSYLLFVWLE